MDTQSSFFQLMAQAPITSSSFAASVPTRLIFCFFESGSTFPSFFKRTMDFFAASRAVSACSAGILPAYLAMASSDT